MSFSLSSTPINGLLAWSVGNGGESYVRIEFPFDLTWCQEQPSTKFRSFQHRKERKGLRHEFIVLQMMDGSICRVERTGDPNARINALSSQGSVAHDLMQCFRPSRIVEAKLCTSDVLAEVCVSNEFDLKDVLNICRAIQEVGKSRNYTLQTFNCYFFSLALQCCLTRLVVDWEHIIPHEVRRSKIKEVFNLLVDIDPIMQPLLRAHSILHPHSWSTQKFLDDVQRSFYKLTSEIAWESVINNVAWYHEIGNTVDGIIMELLLSAWWEITESYLEPRTTGSTSSIFRSGNGSEPLVDQCASALWDLVQVSGIHKQCSLACALLRKLKTAKPRYMRSDSSYQVKHMDYKGTKSDELEQIKSLTISQWIFVIWSHITQIATQVVFFLIAMSMALASVPAPPRQKPLTFIDSELTHIVEDFEHSDKVRTEKLAEFLQKLHELCKTCNSAWKDMPYAHVLHMAKERLISLPSSPPGQEPETLVVALEGQEATQLTTSDFQNYIIRRIELQGVLVERVKLGFATAISNELRDMMSLVWTTIRYDVSVDTYNPIALRVPVDQATQDQTFFSVGEDGIWTLNVPYLKTRDEVKHYLQIALPQLGQGVRQIKCSMCEEKKRYRLCEAKASSLERHISLDLRIKSFECPICGARFVTKDQMNKHIEKKHTGLQEVGAHWDLPGTNPFWDPDLRPSWRTWNKAG
ncbi:hypothetical protein RSOLAG1IB_12160 [Rhizoctonia solani AG-1 IB]|uniref:C2H2-type domain-containing protein n=1 Tax=Thanatephorus cucumeris (strain AG1-IB / isolate 7/3/14) TaxID=1108050 RepID=A0A0B7FKZ7_THACB|nr:hypothetical protein RSOLAG1IB_12160 [Rhizoctonia solani AG-1 IB]